MPQGTRLVVTICLNNVEGKVMTMPGTAAPQGPAAGAFTVSDLKQALVNHGGPMRKAVRDNPKLLKSTFDLLKAVADNKP